MQGDHDAVNSMLDFLLTDESAVSDTAPLDFAQLAPLISPRSNASGITADFMPAMCKCHLETGCDDSELSYFQM